MKTWKVAIRYLVSKYSSILMLFKLTPLQRIVIIGHMRSGSSLLSHILFDNPEIIGIGETHTSYKNKNYHSKLMASILVKNRAFYFSKKVKYVLDKILHHYIIDEAILQDDTTRIILLIRTPEEAIPSMLHLYSKGKRNFTSEKALAYYIDRLNFVLSTFKKYPDKCFFIDYADFLVDNEQILKDLTVFLGLKEPLTPSYKTKAHTGKKGFGDTSSNIRSGKILSGDEKKKTYGEFNHLDKAMLEKAMAIYNEVKDTCLIK